MERNKRKRGLDKPTRDSLSALDALIRETSEDEDPQREDEFTTAELMAKTGWSHAKARRILSKMIQEGKITKRGKKVIFYLKK